MKKIDNFMMHIDVKRIKKYIKPIEILLIIIGVIALIVVILQLFLSYMLVAWGE